ncbi:hypothetical protein H2204_012152 [Knufia peltigerae]|uniref:Uncharacterized protein n=1 Tax=Knufia peltigerae TaxID=1002370 RepID=A0AA38XU40_9EURO|nr:hypothetical protein H2204_012152 [Knufia peltigerae]
MPVGRPNALVRKQKESTTPSSTLMGDEATTKMTSDDTTTQTTGEDDGDTTSGGGEDVEDVISDHDDDNDDNDSDAPYCENWDAFVVYYTWTQMIMRIYHFEHWTLIGLSAVVFLLCYGSLDLGRL